MSKILSSNAPTPKPNRKYVTIPITLRAFEVEKLDEMIKNKRFKELWKPSECSRSTEVLAAVRHRIASEVKRLETVERPQPIKRSKQNDV